jgi:micrococcal nuclease
MKKVLILFLFSFIFITNVYAKRDLISDIECMDGDTIRAIIDGKKERIRFIAINSPETKYSTKDKDEPYAKEASDYTCNLLLNGKVVEIEYDEKSNKTDKYGRVLGWIFIDDVLLQKKLVSKGYAKVDYIYDKYKYVDELKKEESNAKKNKLGIWSETVLEDEEDLEDKSIFEKIIYYIWDNIKILFKKIYETKSYSLDTSNQKI